MSFPDHAARILADPNWPALATILADAEAGGHTPHQLLTEAAARRELGGARLPAKVLIARIQHTSYNPAPNRTVEAALLRSSAAPLVHHPTTNPSSATTAFSAPVPIADTADHQRPEFCCRCGRPPVGGAHSCSLSL
ncbi:hypothetical protein SAMN06272789_3434 [Streptomyces sp. 1331.2]|nr:hypothetical protein SAMN06272789_3434 [Streptomyces sp. 1331.2]